MHQPFPGQCVFLKRPDETQANRDGPSLEDTAADEAGQKGMRGGDCAGTLQACITRQEDAQICKDSNGSLQTYDAQEAIGREAPLDSTRQQPDQPQVPPAKQQLGIAQPFAACNPDRTSGSGLSPEGASSEWLSQAGPDGKASPVASLAPPGPSKQDPDVGCQPNKSSGSPALGRASSSARHATQCSGQPAGPSPCPLAHTPRCQHSLAVPSHESVWRCAGTTGCRPFLAFLPS